MAYNQAPLLHESGIIQIAVDKGGVPPGSVLLEDAGSLIQGIHDSLARLIHRQLGYPSRTKLRGDAKNLVAVTLTDVRIGSGILQCSILPAQRVAGRPPAAIAIFDIISAIKEFQERGSWPTYLPAIVRNRLGSAVAPVFSDGARVILSAQERNRSLSCDITPNLRAALQKPEEFISTEPVVLVGKIFDINIANKTFKVDTSPKRITIHFTDELTSNVDMLRWKRIFVQGYPIDERCKEVERPTGLRLASEDEKDGIIVPGEGMRAEATDAFKIAKRKAEELKQLSDKWDTYDALKPSEPTLAFALCFLRDTISVLLDFGIELPIPFLVSTPLGGVQFEFSKEARYLELEITAPESFLFLTVHNGQEGEGSASRWDAIRLLRWVSTGEEV